MTPDVVKPSYRALLTLPDLPRVVASMFLARTAQTMTRVGLILFTLAEFGSPALAGIVTFASFVPGILASPVAGALLDRHGRVRLIGLDYLVAAATMAAIGALSLIDLLTAEALVALAVVASLTGPLSMTGLRSLFPLLVPARLWERVNAVDSNAFVVANMGGPLLAAGSIALLGPAAAMLTLAVPYGLAAVVLRGVHDPDTAAPKGERILTSAWQGLQYTWRNRTLRGLGIAIATLTFASGVVSIAVPVIVLDDLGGSELAVGLAFAFSGLAGMTSVLLFGRIDSRGRELRLLVLPMLGLAPVIGLFAMAASPLGVATPLLGFAILCLALVGMGLLEGPLDIGLFTIRQRRTDPAWFGRAFAISMAVNAMGYPIGAAVAGMVAETSLEAAIALGVVACLVAAGLAFLLIPRHDPGPRGAVVPAAAGGTAGGGEGPLGRPAEAEARSG